MIAAQLIKADACQEEDLAGGLPSREGLAHRGSERWERVRRMVFIDKYREVKREIWSFERSTVHVRIFVVDVKRS